MRKRTAFWWTVAGGAALAWIPFLAAQEEGRSSARDGDVVKPAAPRDEFSEPPLELTIRVNGEEHAALLDRELRVREGDCDLRLRVSVRPTRTLRAAGLRFQYPREFSFAAERGAAMSTWTLDGNACVVMVMQVSGVESARRFADAMIQQVRSQYGPDNCEESAAQLRLDGRTVSGRRLTARIASATLVQEYFTLPGADEARVLMLQDMPDEGKASDEFVRARKLLEKSFRFVR